MKIGHYDSEFCKKCKYLSLRPLCQHSQCPMDGCEPCYVCKNCQICKIAIKIFEEKQNNKK